MREYHLYFYILKFIILVLIALMSLKIIPVRNKLFVLIDCVFKISLSVFIIIFFSTKKFVELESHDRLLIILSGFILLLLIDYIKVINILFNLHIKDDREELRDDINE
jgi:hypothetical protein